MEHGLIPAIHPSGSGETFAGAGGDRLVVRLATAGPCPITLVEDTSSDRSGHRAMRFSNGHSYRGLGVGLRGAGGRVAAGLLGG
jgi:hypothetical protein